MQSVILGRCPRCGGACMPPEDSDIKAECVNCGWHKYRQAPPPIETGRYRTRPGKYEN